MADRNGRNPHSGYGYGYGGYGHGHGNYDDSEGYAGSAYAAADAAAARNSGRSYSGAPRRAGSLAGSRYPNPSTAYGSYSYPAPGSGGRSFGRSEEEEEVEEEEGGGRRRLSGDGRGSPLAAPKAPSGRVSPREAEIREAAVAAKRARVASANGFSSYSGGVGGGDVGGGAYGGDLPPPPRDVSWVPGGAPSRRVQSRPALAADARYREGGRAYGPDARYPEGGSLQGDGTRYRERGSAQDTGIRYREGGSVQDAGSRYREGGGGGRARTYSDQLATQQQHQRQQQQQQQYDARPWRRSSSPRDDFAGNSSAGGTSRSGDDSPLAEKPRRGSGGWGAAAGAARYAQKPASSAASTPAATAAAAAAAAAVAAAAVVDPKSVAWPSVEAEGEWQLGEPAEERRLKTEQGTEGLSAFEKCPLRGCSTEISVSRDASWMQQHLRWGRHGVFRGGEEEGSGSCPLASRKAINFTELYAGRYFNRSDTGSFGLNWTGQVPT